MTNEKIVIDSEQVMSIEITYDNIVKLIKTIEEEHWKLKLKFVEYQRKSQVSKKPLWQKRLSETSYMMDALAIQYCDVLKVAQDYGWIDDLLNETWLNKWWAEQVEQLKSFLKEQKTQQFGDPTSEMLSTSSEWILPKVTPIESVDFSELSEKISHVEAVKKTTKRTSKKTNQTSTKKKGV